MNQNYYCEPKNEKGLIVVFSLVGHVGRVVFSRERCTAVFLVQPELPNGVPLMTLSNGREFNVCLWFVHQRLPLSWQQRFFSFRQPVRCLVLLLSRPGRTVLLFFGTCDQICTQWIPFDITHHCK